MTVIARPLIRNSLSKYLLSAYSLSHTSAGATVTGKRPESRGEGSAWLMTKGRKQAIMGY